MGSQSHANKINGAFLWTSYDLPPTPLLYENGVFGAVTSAKSVGKLGALVSEPLYMVFHKNKVYLHRRPKFLTKVVFNFYIHQAIYLPTFFQKPHVPTDEQKFHSLDMRRALAFYLDCTRPFTQLFVVIVDSVKSKLVSTLDFLLDFLLHLFVLLVS